MKLAESHGLVVRTVEYDWGTRVRPAEVDVVPPSTREGRAPHALRDGTGVIQPIRELAEVARARGALVIVDAVSSLGAVPFQFDAWGIDVAVGGSQKALSASPGIAFVATEATRVEAHLDGDAAAFLSTGRSTRGSAS